MLKKLLKYDLKYVCKELLLFYCLTIICAIVSKIFSFKNNNLFVVEVLNTIFIILTFIMIAVVLMYNMTRLWLRFSNTVYGDESYLTHTLPITKNDIYFTKILTAIITITASVLVSFTATYIINGIPNSYCYQSFEILVDSSGMTEEEHEIMMQENMMKNIEENQQQAVRGYKESLFIHYFNWFAILLFLIWVTLTGYFAIIIGNNANKGKRTESIIWGISLFFLCICLNYLLLSPFTIFGEVIFTQSEIDTIIITYYGFIIILYYVLGIRQLKNNINVA